MSKKEKLKRLYEKIELDSTDDRILLSKVKKGNASKDEIDELLDIIKETQNGGKILDEIKDFEKNIVKEINDHINILEEMVDEYFDVAHIEDETEKKLIYTDMKSRFKKHVTKAEEIIDAMKIAYFQIDNFVKYENQLYDVREKLSYFE